MNQAFERCVVVVDEALAPGRAANAAAVLAVTLGASAPDLVGSALVDADGHRHPGLIDRGLPVLTAGRTSLGELARRALALDVGLVALPASGQQTTDYEGFRRQVAGTALEDLAFVAILVHGPKRAVNRLTGQLPLLR